MNEQLYTIPVNDAFDKDCECPICSMYETLQKNAVEFVMGPSYMEDDVRMETDKIGFCEEHIKLMYANQNRLGLALMLKTHMDKTIKDIEKLAGGKRMAGGFFKKKDESPIVSYIQNLNQSCYVCQKINGMFGMYISSLFYLYKHEEDFKRKFKASKGFCTRHYGLLYERAEEALSGNVKEEFIDQLNQVYLENMKRVRDDVEWFTDKFDYRYVNEPWKNSKDAVQRSILKVDSTLVEEHKE